MKFLHRKAHREEVEQAQQLAEKAKADAAATKKKWADVRRDERVSQQLRKANGWTEAVGDIFGGRA